MADFSEWGGGGGVSSAIADQGIMSQTNARNAMLPGALQLQQAEIQMQPAKMMNLMAESGLRLAEAGLKNEALRQTKLMSAAMSSMSQGPGTDQGTSTGPDGQPTTDQTGNVIKTNTPIDAMINAQSNMLNVAMKNGAVDAAMHVASNLQALMGHAATLQKNQWEMKHQEHVANLDKIQRAGALLNGVDDQDSFDNAASQWYKEFKEPAPFANPNNPNWALPYSPKIVDSLQQKTLSYKDKLAADNREATLALKEDNLARMQRYNDTIADLRRQVVQVSQDREQRLATTGGKVSEPNPRQVQDAADYIQAEDPRFKDLSGDNLKLFNVFAKDVTYEANKIRKANPGIKYSESLAQAFDKNKDRLDIIAPPTLKIPFTNIDTGISTGSTTLKLNKGGVGQGTQDNPITVGPGFDPRAVKEGNYYLKDGKLGKVVNGRVELVQ